MSKTPTILVLNGPNLNMLGKREPAIYGTATLDEIILGLTAEAKKSGVDIMHQQSNAEHELVEAIQTASRNNNIKGIIINAGALTHSSIALHDAIKLSGLPTVEVHLSNVFAREEFRHHSYISAVARAVIVGAGSDGYHFALQFLIKLPNDKD
ncbi:MAG: type II 3-dehydroquinate dehydratase [Hydrotalea sp.]|nr:type II 3-dehydroquinate dehydratase [Hydrotalea sp.]